MIMVQHFSSESFEKAIAGDQPVLVDFWATWCGPCRMIAPVIEQVAAEFEGRAVVGKVDVDEEPGLAQRFGVMSIPTLVVLKDGKVVEQAVGARGRADVAAMIERHL
jgi:thioredoxin 1